MVQLVDVFVPPPILTTEPSLEIAQFSVLCRRSESLEQFAGVYKGANTSADKLKTF